ncbi:MAG: lamin tail domain-containing protein, partial [Clostridia bacterium]|nr:lamin tail domain-containing protein [Clostridia bacterium]
LYNRSEGRINLSGWCLSDNKTKPTKWGLPAAYMEAGEYFVIFASGKDGVFDGEYHTNFALSSAGETLYLVSPSGGIEQELEIPPLKSDIAYGLKDHRNSNEYCFYASGMPGRVNVSASADSIEGLAGNGKKLEITEYMNNNKSLIKDNYGDFSDFIEITNSGEEDCSLAGLYLSDDEQNLQKWEIPGNVTLAPGQSTVVWTSGRNEYKDGVLHASFGLSSSNKAIYLSDTAGVIASLEIEYLPANISKGKNGEKWQYYAKPTPGEQNTAGFESVTEACGINAKKVWINEVSSVATKEGSYDWIEIYNGSDEDILLDGFSITDDLSQKGYVFENYTIKAGQYRIL